MGGTQADGAPHRHAGRILLALVGLAFLLRASVLWFTRPEFVGWFNHAPWYWVQTRGLLESGALPFADLPLLFMLYAGLATGLQLFGLSLDTAIVHGSRALMSLVPALMAWPFALIVRAMTKPGPLPPGAWLLVGLSMFLPLTFVHMPELLQKNQLGLLLFTALLASSLRWLQRGGFPLGSVVLFLALALTHLGTLVVALLWVLALTLARYAAPASQRRPWLAPLALAAALTLASLTLYMIDPAALHRVAALVSEGLRQSLLGHLFGEATPALRALILFALILLAAGLWGGYRFWHRSRHAVTPALQQFWLANGWLVALLLACATVLDVSIAPRLALFLPLPLLVLLAFALTIRPRPRLARTALALATLTCLAGMVGETADLLRPYPDKRATQAELQALREQWQLGPRDFVIAPYAVTPMANWYLGTKAGLITSLERQDFTRHERVFILNSGWERAPQDMHGRRAGTENARYRIMRSAVPIPDNAQRDERFSAFRFYAVPGPPLEWRWDETRHWQGVAAADPPADP